MRQEPVNAKRFVYALMGALVPSAMLKRLSAGFQDWPDPPGEQERAQAITLAETTPFDEKIVLGPRFPSYSAIKRILSMARDMKRRRINANRATFTCHLEGGANIDIVVGRPYLLRKDKGGCIVQVYDEVTSVTDAPEGRNIVSCTSTITVQL